MKYDAIHAVAVGSIALRLFARERTAWGALTTEPLESSAAVVVFYAFLSMMGNSPLAWLAVSAYASVSQMEWDGFVEATERTFGPMYDGWAGMALGLLSFAFFTVPYLLQGLLLLP